MKRNAAQLSAWLDVKDVAERYGVKVATVWRWAREGKLPQPVRLTPGTSRWSIHDLREWESMRKQSSGGSRREFDDLERRKRRPLVVS